jgi:hypothetical protein
MHEAGSWGPAAHTCAYEFRVPHHICCSHLQLQGLQNAGSCCCSCCCCCCCCWRIDASALTLLYPAVCPSIFRIVWASAKRLLPSMMKATCWGTCPARSSRTSRRIQLPAVSMMLQQFKGAGSSWMAKGALQKDWMIVGDQCNAAPLHQQAHVPGRHMTVLLHTFSWPTGNSLSMKWSNRTAPVCTLLSGCARCMHVPARCMRHQTLCHQIM